MRDPAAYAVVLAAGTGSRFGGAKLLAPLEGRPLVAHVAATVARAVSTGTLAGGVAVIPPNATALAWYWDTAGLGLVTNPDPAAGLAASLQRGLAALESLIGPARPAAALIVLADQPRIRGDVIERLVEVWRAHGRSTRPRYAGSPDTPGHPVLLDRALWPLARDLTGDRGLGELLGSRPEAVSLVDVPGANPDVDTPADLRQLEEPME
jgi:CTP:molybdopterin cytidylyltransferase MocA